MDVFIPLLPVELFGLQTCPPLPCLPPLLVPAWLMLPTVVQRPPDRHSAKGLLDRGFVWRSSGGSHEQTTRATLPFLSCLLTRSASPQGRSGQAGLLGAARSPRTSLSLQPPGPSLLGKSPGVIQILLSRAWSFLSLLPSPDFIDGKANSSSGASPFSPFSPWGCAV